MKKLSNITKLSTVALIVTSILGCGSETDSSKLAKEVELEKLRENGTIIETVSIENSQVRLKAGETHQLIATGIDSNGDSRDITDELTWQTSDESIAKISSSGLLTALKNADSSQGLLTITATTINDIFDEEEISISDVAASSISLKQIAPASGSINTCMPARISADITYADGYIAQNSIRGVTFSIDEDSTARINNQGIIYTSAANIENTTVTGTINNVSGELVVTADLVNLESLNLIVAEETVDEITLNVGEQIQLAAQATYDESVSEQAVNINPSVNWSVINAGLVGLSENISTDEGDNATILALKPGVTQLIGSCGPKQKIATLVIEGNDDLNSIQINEGNSEYTISPSESLDLQLTANYNSSPQSLNVTEFATWSTNDSNLITAKLINPGTQQAAFRVTSKANNLGTAVITVTYDSQVSSTLINIE